jgi:glutamyl-tRNA synthetase
LDFSKTFELLTDFTTLYSVPVTIKGGPAQPEVKSVPKHKKNTDVGDKKTVYSSTILVEQEDAISFEDNEEVYSTILSIQSSVLPLLNTNSQITLMDWGNAFIRSKTTNASGQVISIEMELHLDGDFRKTKKKITWLAQPTDTHSPVPATLLDYDYLITKKKLEENDNLDDYITPVTEFREEALADANINDLKKGDIIQFERKGYYIYDGEADGVKQFILIPDGRAASIALKATPATSTSTGARASSATVESASPFADASKMYRVDSIYGEKVQPDISNLKMYKMDSVYSS